MTEYAKQIAATGQNLEELTNKLLEITRNPTMYDPNQVLNAKNELDKLGTTGAIDLSERIEITPQLAQVLGNSIGYGLNEYIYSLLSRIGTIRTGDSGTGDPQRGEGYVVTAEHVADYLNKLGLDVSATMVQALSESSMLTTTLALSAMSCRTFSMVWSSMRMVLSPRRTLIPY